MNHHAGFVKARLCPEACVFTSLRRRSKQPEALQHHRGVQTRQNLRLGRRAVVVRAGVVDKIDAEQLQVAINERDRPLIIDFYATWCGPCLLLAKELEQVAQELGDSVRIVKVDTDENAALANQLQIAGLPTLVFVGTDPTKPAIRTEGLLPAATIKDIVTTELANVKSIS